MRLNKKGSEKGGREVDRGGGRGCCCNHTQTRKNSFLCLLVGVSSVLAFSLVSLWCLCLCNNIDLDKFHDNWFKYILSHKILLTQGTNVAMLFPWAMLFSLSIELYNWQLQSEKGHASMYQAGCIVAGQIRWITPEINWELLHVINRASNKAYWIHGCTGTKLLLTWFDIHHCCDLCLDLIHIWIPGHTSY